MKGQKGFTLLEIMLAVTIFSVGMLAVASMQVTAIRGNYFSGATTDATTLAADRLEKMMNMDYLDPDLNDTDGDGTGEDTAPVDGVDDDGGNFGLDDTDAAADRSQTDASGTYTTCWNVAENVPVNNTKTVNVIITWSDGGSQRSFAMQGIKAR
jgi:prepilin-type N-terminal cleavage/methylation domain-containing protein